MRLLRHWFQSNSFKSSPVAPSNCPVQPEELILYLRPTIHFLPFPIPYPLFPPLCYNHPAVERAAKWQQAQVQAEPAQAAAQSVASSQDGQSTVAPTEDPSRYCPVCSQPLESRRCKLICSVCGYYMSCSDYY